jgi:HSP20 family protein
MRLVHYHPRMTPISSLIRDPFSELEHEFERIFGSALAGAGAAEGANTQSLAQVRADMFEDKDHYYVRLEVPGVKREDLHVEMGDAVLTIKGERKLFTGEGQDEQRLSFERSLSLPTQVQGDQVSASYQDGILTVTLPKREEAKPRRVAIEVK